MVGFFLAVRLMVPTAAPAVSLRLKFSRSSKRKGVELQFTDR